MIASSRHLALGVVVHSFNPGTREPEAGGFMWLQGQHGLHSELQDSQGYIVTSCLEKENERKELADLSCFWT